MDEQKEIAQRTDPDAAPPSAGDTAASPARDGLQPGEKAFTIALFLAGLFFLIQSLSLWGRMDEPRIASAAALPLFMSAIWTALSFAIILENIRKKTPLSAFKRLPDIFAKGLSYTFPRPVPVMLLAIVAYCASLLLHISFYITTPLFLWGSMSYLTRRGYLKNILWTAVCMGFIVLVFRMLFGVILP